MFDTENEIFDIVADSRIISVQETLWNAKFDKQLYDNHKRSHAEGFCMTIMCRDWEISKATRGNHKHMNHSRCEHYSFLQADYEN